MRPGVATSSCGGLARRADTSSRKGAPPWATWGERGRGGTGDQGTGHPTSADINPPPFRLPSPTPRPKTHTTFLTNRECSPQNTHPYLHVHAVAHRRAAAALRQQCKRRLVQRGGALAAGRQHQAAHAAAGRRPLQQLRKASAGRWA